MSVFEFLMEHLPSEASVEKIRGNLALNGLARNTERRVEGDELAALSRERERSAECGERAEKRGGTVGELLSSHDGAKSCTC